MNIYLTQSIEEPLYAGPRIEEVNLELAQAKCTNQYPGFEVIGKFIEPFDVPGDDLNFQTLLQ